MSKLPYQLRLKESMHTDEGTLCKLVNTVLSMKPIGDIFSPLSFFAGNVKIKCRNSTLPAHTLFQKIINALNVSNQKSSLVPWRLLSQAASSPQVQQYTYCIGNLILSLALYTLSIRFYDYIHAAALFYFNSKNILEET